jgi:DNA polymerase-4
VAHAELGTLAIAHLDCDAFYASVEKRDRPELRDKPVIVGGARRGVVTTACYIARLSGVRSAMPMFKALALCPGAVVIAPDFSKYRAESRRILDKLRALTPLVEPLSLDEAWLDLSGTRRLHGAAPALILGRLQAEIERDVGLTVSVGLAPNKLLAKIASEMDKPRGYGVIGAADAAAVLAPRPVSILPGIGPSSARALASRGINTVGDVARADPGDLMGDDSRGARLSRLAIGRDDRPVEPGGRRKSLSAEATFDTDLRQIDDLEARLWTLCDRVARHARAEGIAGRAVTLKLRTHDFRTLSRRRAAPRAIQTAKTLFAIASGLLREQVRGEAYRLVGVGLVDLAPASESAELFTTADTRALRAETALDSLRRRFGEDAVTRGRALKR